MSIVSVVKGVGAELNPFDSGKTYATYNPPATTTPKAPTVSTAGSGANYDPSSDIDALNKEIAAEQANYQALQNQVAAQPKLPVYNTSAAWANAQKAATAAVDPVYTDKLNQYLQQEQLDTAQQTAKDQSADTAADTALANQTADNATTQTRATQDQTTGINQTNQSEGNYQADSGTAYDQARNALLGTVANSGLTTSGIGQGQVASSQAARNQGDVEQTEGFDNSRQAINTTAQRTFEDLATSNTRNTAANATTKAADATDLQNYIDNANLAEQQERTQNELDEQSAIASTTNQEYQQGVQQFIASLVGSGARAQDVALASQVYGA